MSESATATRSPDLTLDASDSRFYAEANRPAYLQIHAEDPVYWIDAEHTQPFWNVCRHDLIREVGKRVELFTTEFGVHLNAAAFTVKPTLDAAAAPGVTSELPIALRPANIMDAANHRRLRAPLNPHFRHDNVAQLEAGVREEVRGILDRLESGVQADFVRAFATRVPLLVTTRLLGVSSEREHDFEHWANVVLESFEPGAQPDFAALGEMVAFFSAEVAARRRDPRADLITALTRSALTDEEVVMWCWLLLVAGLETTGNLIAGGLDLLLRHPDQQERVAADPSLIRPAVAEMLRMLTPGRYIRRTATADAELGGHTVRTGDAVVMNFTVANYDPVMFADPLAFDVERNPNDALAFSYGPHRCVGMSVARLESAIAFEELLARYPNTERCGDAVLRPSLATAVVECMPVIFRA
jgi:cytochrome P450